MTLSVGPVSGAYVPTQAQPAGQTGFAVPVCAPPSGPDVRGVAQSAPVEASLMLALQEQVGVEAGDREARRHGQRLLAALADLQHAMLCGSEADTLAELSRLADEEGQAVDPMLAAAIRSIRLRARLELVRAAKAMVRPLDPGS